MPKPTPERGFGTREFFGATPSETRTKYRPSRNWFFLQREGEKINKLKGKRRRLCGPPPLDTKLNESTNYGVLFAGFSLLNFKVISTTPAATFKPFCPSIDTGCNAIELLKPPTNTLAPAPTPTAALAVAPP